MMLKQTSSAISMLKKAYVAVFFAALSSVAMAESFTLTALDKAYTADDPEGLAATWFGPTGTNTLTGHNVTINLPEGTLGAAYGGYGTTTDTVSGNALIVSGSSVVDSAFGGFSTNGAATDNQVLVDTNATAVQVVGGRGESATNNLVHVKGKVGDYGVIGGAAENAYGNEVILDNGAVITGAVIGGGLDIFHPVTGGNSLSVTGPATVGALAGFDKITLQLQDNGKAALTVNGGSKLFFESAGVTQVYNQVNLSDTTLNLVNYKDGADQTLISVAKNDYITNGIAINGNTKLVSDNVYVKDTWSAKVSDITAIGDDLTSATLSDETLFAKAQEVSHKNVTTLSDAVLGTAALVNQSAEFVAADGINAMREATADVYGVAPFGAIVGGYSEYQTGSHVDLASVHALVGIAGTTDKFTSAVYGEFGYGDSSSHVSGVSADAKHNYYGLGLAGHYALTGNAYLNGSVHIGTTNTDFDGAYAEGIAAYDIDQLYVGAHVGGGYVVPFNDKVNLDLYGRYTYTYTEGDKTKVAGEEFKLDAVNTHALRLGGRLNGYLNEYVQGYTGLAIEQVLDGDATGTVSHVALATPSLEGTTGIGEIGLSLRPSSKVQVNVGAKGYVGDRRGVQGSVIGLYTF